MSWVEKRRQDFIIQTGDGRNYTFFWKNPELSIEFNVAFFEYPNTPGTLVLREEKKGDRIPLELFVPGPNNLEITDQFLLSARNKKFWTLRHPFYGDKKVHPVSIRRRDSGLNNTKLEIEVVETIFDNVPTSVVAPRDQITLSKTRNDTLFLANFIEANPVPDVRDIDNLRSVNTNYYNRAASLINNDLQAQEYFNLFQDANRNITNYTGAPLGAITSLQAVISYPSQFQTSVGNRLQLLTDTFNDLVTSINTITSPTKSEKSIFEVNGAANISTICEAVGTPQDTDYETRGEVLEVVESVLATYGTYITTLDGLQTETGAEIDSYVPTFEPSFDLNSYVNFTLSNLFTIALNARQERIIFLDSDTNPILLLL